MDKSTILEIYEYIEMNKKTTKEYRKLANIFGARREEFEKTLIDKQKEDLDELLMSMENMDGQEMREYFVERIYNSCKTNGRGIL